MLASILILFPLNYKEFVAKNNKNCVFTYRSLVNLRNIYKFTQEIFIIN